ncbi:MAG TPA: alginate export family protein [Candidatus Limnocylindrales bacterium]|nr:alginate export family protein [Candidatus Limnocylindrales bacterium]
MSEKRGMSRAFAALAIALPLSAGIAAAAGETPAAADAPHSALSKLKISGAWRFRNEVWDFFEPSGVAGANNTYDFVGSDLRLAATWTDDWFDALVEGQGVFLGNLPDHATGGPTEGPLGLGALYRANNGDNENEGDVYLRQGALKLKKLGVPGLWVRGGRLSLSEGKEAISAEPTLAWLANMRIAERLIGPFDFTYAGRSFDSAQVSWTHDAYNVTAFGGKPTQGGVAIDGMDEIDDIAVGYASVNLTSPSYAKNTAARLFYIYYEDDRPVDNKPLVMLDNRPLAIRQADVSNISIHTIGGDVLQVVPTPIGPVDLLGWFAYQGGDWGSLDHSAWAFAFEAGLQPSKLPWKPWLRAGFDMGSGDNNNTDGDHETFFQILPTARVYSWSTFYNLMNSEDAFVQVILRPKAGLVWRTDLHVVRLSDDDDLWYFGGGAAREHKQPGFGFGGRPSDGKDSLMEVLETQVSYNWNDYVATTFYYGHMFGEDVVESDFSGKSANYAFMEFTLKLPPMGPN